MALSDAKVMVSLCIERKHLEQIDKWAAKLGMSRSKICCLMIEDSVDEMGWAYDVATTRVGLKIRELVKAVREMEARKEAAGVVPAA